MTPSWWRPDRLGTAPRQARRARGRILGAVRDFFAAADYVEVDTPALQVSPGLEPHLQGLRDRAARPARRQRAAALSPYLARIRDEEAAGGRAAADLAARARLSRRRAQRDPSPRILDARMVPRRRRISRPDDRVRGAAALRSGQRPALEALRWRGRSADARRPWQRLTVAEAFERHAGIDLLATAPDPARPDAGAARRRGGADRHRAAPGRRLGDAVLPHLSRTHRAASRDPVRRPSSTITRWRSPRCRAPSPDDPRLAERFELYVCGLELANAFGELTDPAEQRAGFAADQARKQALYGETYPIDEDFLAALGEDCRSAPASRSVSTDWSCC